MKVLIKDIKAKIKDSVAQMIDATVRKYGIKGLKSYQIVKRSLDVRNEPIYVYSVLFELDKIRKSDNHIDYDFNYITTLDIPNVHTNLRPIVVGFGPSGMFCALVLAKAGLKPIVLERGFDVDTRIKDVEKFLEKGLLNPKSNISFGEGGAGTFSDGKLTTNLNDKYIRYILEEFVQAGANPEIAYIANPHIGTDVLRVVVKNIRKKIISLGGEVLFNHQFISYQKNKDNIEIKVDNNDKALSFLTNHLILALGHSARDTITTLYNNGLEMKPKPFSMGVRVEHNQAYINSIQYHGFENIYQLPSASYKINAHLENGRGIYSFCMCPGGEVINSTDEDNHIILNGMSNFKRDNINANSAILVDVRVDDYYKNSPLDGIKFQDEYEKKAYEISNSYKAPANLMKEFLEDKIASNERSVHSSYRQGLFFCDLKEILPNFVYEGLKEGIPLLNKRMKGFYFEDAIMLGIESRSSSPVRINRNEDYEAIEGIYPIGEGAGYAGGITSSALDGVRVALKIIEQCL